MESLRSIDISPFPRISAKAVAKQIREALHSIFKNTIGGVWFVGGSALAGYYAEHRTSDDIDLFAANEAAYHSAVLAVKALKKEGAYLKHESTSPLFYRADVMLKDHSFTTAVVMDENIHRVGRALRTQDGVWVADFKTLLAMKIACLVSRCSEKDLFDLCWMFEKVQMPAAEEIISMGQELDGGLNVETLIASIGGATLRKQACGFLLPNSEVTVDQAYRRIVKLRKTLLEMLLKYEKAAPLSPEAQALARSARDMKRF